METISELKDTDKNFTTHLYMINAFLSSMEIVFNRLIIVLSEKNCVVFSNSDEWRLASTISDDPCLQGKLYRTVCVVAVEYYCLQVHVFYKKSC